jgi:hypothetical protein
MPFGQQSQGGGGLDDLLGGLMGGGASGGQGGGSPLDALLGGQAPGGPSGQQMPFGEQPQGGGGLGDLLGGLMGAGGAPGGGAQGGGGGGLGDLLGSLMGGGQPGMGQAPSQGMPGGGQEGTNWLQALLPAALAFMQAKQSGAETPQAAGQALLAVLAGGQINPMQSGAPRPAAGGLIAQSLLQAFMSR